MNVFVVRTTRSVANISVGPEYRGRIVNALGVPLDGMGGLILSDQERRSLESPAPSILDRRSVHEPFATGITVIDASFPWYSKGPIHSCRGHGGCR